MRQCWDLMSIAGYRLRLFSKRLNGRSTARRLTARKTLARQT